MIKPKRPTDLTLAPVAAEIDLNLQALRDARPYEIVDQVALALNSAPAETRGKRAKQILEVATRQVDLHGWKASISKDATRVELRGGSVRLDVALSAKIRDYIEAAS
ncbi:MAG TPA: hypothetical protein VI408_09280 [Gaiellaceae bacterium]